MAKITQNAVLNKDGSRFKLTAAVVSVTGYLAQYNALRNVQAVDADGTITGTKDAPLFLDGDGKPTAENTGRPLVVARPRSGYDKYFNDDGFVNPISPEALSPQGVGKLMAKLTEVAYTIIGEGGPDAKEMTDILGALEAYRAEAPKVVAKRKRRDQLLAAVATLGDGDAANAIRAVAAKEGINLDDEVPAVPAAVIAEPTGGNAEADETEDAEAETANA
jgi:hypothetical protein